MIYRLINGEQVIAKVISNFNLDNSDWIAKSPQWILDGLSDIRITSHLEVQSKEVEIVDRKITLPCDIKSLVNIEYNGDRVIREDIVTGEDSEDLTYQLLHNNDVLFNSTYFYNGDVATIYFKSLPMTISPIYNIYIPSVPDNFDVIEALTYYVLMKYLLHGYKHKLFNLESNNLITNPSLRFYGPDMKSGLRLVARNSINSPDKDAQSNIQDRAAMLNENPVGRRNRQFKK